MKNSNFIKTLLEDYFVFRDEQAEAYLFDNEQPGILDYLPEYLATRLDDYLNSDQFVEDLEALGAGLLAQKDVKVKSQRAQLLRLAGMKLRRQLVSLHENVALKREQRKRITTLTKREIRRVQQLHKMDPQDFEYWVAGYFKRCRYRKVMVTQYSADFGIDVHMYTSGGVEAVAQVKRYRKPVGRPVVQQTYGAMTLVGAKRCFVVTSGRFTRAALALAEENSDIYLIDGAQLVKGACPSLKRRGGRSK